MLDCMVPLRLQRRKTRFFEVLTYKSVSLAKLKKELNVTERSIYRYIASLKNAGFPIYYDSQKGGYAFPDSFSLKKAVISHDEQLILYLAENLTQTALGKEATAVFEKIKNFVRIPEKKNFSEYMVIKTDADLNTTINIFQTISNAIENHQLLKIKYPKGNQQIEERTIEPYFLYWTGEFWYLYAWCKKKEANRTFAVNKILSAKSLQNYFVPSHYNLKLEDLELNYGPFIFEEGSPVEIIIQFTPEIKEVIQRKKWFKNQKNKILPNNWLEVKINIREVDNVKLWLYRWIPHFKIISPEWFKKEVVDEIQKCLGLNREKT